MTKTSDDFQKNGGKAAKCGLCGSTSINGEAEIAAKAPRPTRADTLAYLKQAPGLK